MFLVPCKDLRISMGLAMKFLKIPTSFRDISDYIYSHLLPRDCVISDLKGINYYTFILVQCVSL